MVILILPSYSWLGVCRLVPAANSASYISFMADAHWAASARMPSNLLLAEAVSAAQEAGRHGHHPDALHCLLLLHHLTHCCQAYRQVLTPIFPPPPPPPPPHPPPPPTTITPLPPTTITPVLLILPLLLSPLCNFLLSLFLFLFFAPATFTFSNSTICSQLQISRSTGFTPTP